MSDYGVRPSRTEAVPSFQRRVADADPPIIDPLMMQIDGATSHDARIVKYVLACIGAASDDNDGGNLFLAAAQRLLDVWAENGGEPDDLLLNA